MDSYEDIMIDLMTQLLEELKYLNENLEGLKTTVQDMSDYR